MTQFTKLFYTLWIKTTCQWVHRKIPRGEEWLDSLVDKLELENNNGHWKSILGNNDKLKESFIYAIQQLYVSRREQVSAVEEKRHWNRKLNNIEKSLQVTELKSFPLYGVLEVTENCNLRCPMCPQSYETLNRQDMSLKIREKIQNVLPYLDELELFAFGEILTSETFLPILNSIPRIKGQAVCTSTNGLLLTPEIAEQWIKSPLTKIYYSLNTVDRMTYWKIKGVDGFDKVLANLKTLINSRAQSLSKTPEIWIYFHMDCDNMPFLPDFIRLAKKLGVEGVLGYWLKAYTEDQWQKSPVFDREKTNGILEEATRIAKELNIQIYLPRKFDLSIPRSKLGGAKFSGICTMPWDTFHLNNELSFRPCHINSTRLGQLNGSDFQTVWNGKDYQNYRKNLNSNQRQYRCTHCFDRHTQTDDIHCHLVNLKEHYEELGIQDRLNLPADYSERLNHFIDDFLKGAEKTK